MAVARLVAAPFPLAAARVRGPPARMSFAPLPRRAAVPALRVASDGNGRPDQAAEEDAAPARSGVAERAARKESERRTYLVAALMSSLGITSMAAAAVYYRFAWQMEGGEIPVTEMLGTFALSVGAAVSAARVTHTFVSIEKDIDMVCRVRDGCHGCAGGHGVLGAVGAPGAVARVAVAHARVAPPSPRRGLRAQRRVRHHQRRAGHGPPRLGLLQPRPRPRPLLRRRSRDHAVRDGLHVRPRRPGPPPLPRGPHRERALLPASRRRPFDPPHGQVRQRAIWAVPRPQGAGGGGRDGGAGEGGAEEDQEERQVITSYTAMRMIPALRYVLSFSSLIFTFRDCVLDFFGH